MDFSVFDDKIGVEGYKRLVHKIFFPSPSRKPLNDFIEIALYQLYGVVPRFNFGFSAFNASSIIFPRKTVFSRVRVLTSDEDIEKLINGDVGVSDFYPPNPEKIQLKAGRYNDTDSSVMYLSDSPETAEIECEVKDGDFFLRSQFSLGREMAFFTLSQKSVLTRSLFALINSSDTRFYPVINYLMSFMMRFEHFSGCAYNSIPAGKIKSFKESKLNLAVWCDFIRDIDFEFSFLCYRYNGKLYFKAFYYLENGQMCRLDCEQEPEEVDKMARIIYERLLAQVEPVERISKKLLDDILHPFNVISESR